MNRTRPRVLHACALTLTLLLGLALSARATAQTADEPRAEALMREYAQARRALRLEQGRLRSVHRRLPSLVVHAEVGFHAGEWNIHEQVDGFMSVGADLGLSYRRFWNDRVGMAVGAAAGQSRVSVLSGDRLGYEFGRTDFYVDAALHFCPSRGARFYLGPTLRLGYWRLLREELTFMRDDEWTPDRVPLSHAWVLMGGPHFGWLLGKRSDFDLSVHGFAGSWHESSRWRFSGGAAVRLGYVFAFGRDHVR